METRLFLVLIVTCIPACLSAEDSLRADVQESRLENGLKILIVERPGSSGFAAEMVYKVGSVNEWPGVTGIAHLLEHLMFKGTRRIGTRDPDTEFLLMKRIDETSEALTREKAKDEEGDKATIERLERNLKQLQKEQSGLVVEGELLDIYERNGAKGLNASTSADYTRYYCSLPSDRLELWCLLESDRMRDPVFREFYSERDAVGRERRREFDENPEGLLREQLICTAFTAHPYQRPVIGWSCDIATIQRSEVREFWEKYYIPNNCTMVLVGDVDPDEALPMIKRYFGDIPSGPVPEPVTTIEPRQPGERIARVESNAEPLAYVAYHKPAITHPDQYVADVLVKLLTGGKTSRLHRKMVLEQRIARRVDAWGGPDKYPGLFIFALFPRDPHTVSELIENLDEEIKLLADKPVDDRELQRAKDQLRADYVDMLESNQETAAQIAKYEGMYDWSYINTLTERRDAVTSADIQSFVKKYFAPSNRTIAELVNSR